MSRVKTTLDGYQDSFDKMLGRDKVLGINFGDFELDISGDPFNYKAAERISALLSNRVSIDDIGPCAWGIAYEENADYPQTSIGGCSMYISAPTKGNIYAILASAFAGFAINKRHELYISKEDYYHLKEVYEDYYWQPNVESTVAPLRKTLEQFRTHYADHDKNFLLEIIKESE